LRGEGTSQGKGASKLKEVHKLEEGCIQREEAHLLERGCIQEGGALARGGVHLCEVRTKLRRGGALSVGANSKARQGKAS
jgi:hypothetical protein